MTDNMAYPGNPNLPKEARDKVVSTFRHSLNLFKAGKRQDCAVGCDFILKMDPRFTPARQLLEMARNPAAPANVAELEILVAAMAVAPAPAPPAAPTAPDKLLIEAIEAYASRDFARAIENANRALAALPGNTDAQEILAKAKKKLDLQPHVENFRQRALFALESGQIDEARLNYERMRNLDPEHPAVEALGQRIGSGATAAPSAPAAPAARPAPPPPPNFFSDAPKDDLDIAFDLTEPAPAAAAPAAASAPPAFYDSPPPAPDLWTLPAAGPAPAGAPPPASPVAPPPPAAGMPSSASPSASPDVERLLREGDDFEARGNPQAAIEAWSRIFLIDLNNSEAAARIERTRARLADANRRVSEALRGGRSLYEGGKLKEAREKFLEVLAIDENEPTARSYLNRIEEDLARPQPSFDLSQQVAGGDVLAEDEMPAEPAGAPRGAREKPERAAAPAARKPVPLVIIAGVLLVAIVAGIFVLFRSRSHPPAAPAPPAEAGSRASISEAQRLFKEGKVDEARQILQNIPAADPQYARAQKLLSTFGPGAPTASGTAPATGSAAPAPADAPAQRADAEAALAQHHYIDALKAFNLAAPAYPNDDAFKQQMNQAAQHVQEISSAVKLYNDGDYDAAIPILWRLYQADHANLDVRSYLVRSYYNQGVNALQNNLFDKGSQAFQDALGVEAGDELSQRQKSFADRYRKRTPDLLARIYVKYLRPRP